MKYIGVLLSMLMLATNLMASDAIKLPAPKQVKGTLMQALQSRKSTREFADKDIDKQTLITILWTAYGVTHEGKRTIPTALDKKDLSVYLFNKDGIFVYNADENAIHPISSIDNRSLFATQDYMATAPLILVYVGSKEDYAIMHAGSAYQNVGLYCATNGLNNVVRGYFDKNKISEILGLESDKRPIVSQAIGYPVSVVKKTADKVKDNLKKANDKVSDKVKKGAKDLKDKKNTLEKAVDTTKNNLLKTK